MKRQTFFVNFSGWDHHDEVIENQANMLPVVSRSFSAFYEIVKPTKPFAHFVAVCIIEGLLRLQAEKHIKRRDRSA